MMSNILANPIFRMGLFRQSEGPGRPSQSAVIHLLVSQSPLVDRRVLRLPKLPYLATPPTPTMEP